MSPLDELKAYLIKKVQQDLFPDDPNAEKVYKHLLVKLGHAQMEAFDEQPLTGMRAGSVMKAMAVVYGYLITDLIVLSGIIKAGPVMTLSFAAEICQQTDEQVVSNVLTLMMLKGEKDASPGSKRTH